MSASNHEHQAPEDANLRRLLTNVTEHGWDTPEAHSLLTVLEDHARRWATSIDRHCHLTPGTTEPHDVLTAAWHVLNRFPDRVLQAKAPWAYLWNAVRNAAAVAAVGAAVGSQVMAERHLRECRSVPSPIRVGHQSWRLDRPANIHASDPDGERWSPGLLRFLDLVVEHGGDRALWADAIDRAVEVIADARRSYEEHDLRRDPYLRLVLGLTTDQLRDLGALLIGTRRGNRTEQSLLLALHRNHDVRPEQVPGASVRLLRMLSLGPGIREHRASHEREFGRRSDAA